MRGRRPAWPGNGCSVGQNTGRMASSHQTRTRHGLGLSIAVRDRSMAASLRLRPELASDWGVDQLATQGETRAEAEACAALLTSRRSTLQFSKPSKQAHRSLVRASLAPSSRAGWQHVAATSGYWLRAKVGSNNRAKLALPADVHWHDPPIPAGPDPTPSRAIIPAGIAPAGSTPAGPPPWAPAGSSPCRRAGDPEADTEAHRWCSPAAAPPAATAPTTSPAATVPSSVKAALGGRCTRRQGERRCNAESEKRLLDHDNLQFELRDLNVLRSPWFLLSPSRCTSRSTYAVGPGG